MRLWELESPWSCSWDSGLLPAVTNNATSSRLGLLDGHRGRQCRCAQRGLGKGRATRPDRRTRHMVLWPTGRSIGLRVGLQVQVLPRPLLPVRSSAHGCLSGYGVSEPLGSVTELEPRQTQQFRICLMGSPADGMLWPPWLTWWSVRFVGVRSWVRFRKRRSCVGRGSGTHAVLA